MPQLNEEFCSGSHQRLYCGCSHETPCPLMSTQLLTEAEKTLAARLLAILALAMLSISDRFVGEHDMRERFPAARPDLPLFDHQSMSAYERSAAALTSAGLARPVGSVDSPVHELMIDSGRSAVVVARTDWTKRTFGLAVWSFLCLDQQNGLNGLNASLVDAFAAAGLVTSDHALAFYGWGEFENPEDADLFWSEAMRPYFADDREPAYTFFKRICGPASDGDDFDWPGSFASL
jgi:hypothetical protein